MDLTPAQQIGRNMAALRAALADAPTAKDFAERNGMAANFYQRVERGLQNLTLTTLVRIGAGLNVGLPELVKGVDADSLRRIDPKLLGTGRAAGAAGRTKRRAASNALNT